MSYILLHISVQCRLGIILLLAYRGVAIADTNSLAHQAIAFVAFKLVVAYNEADHQPMSRSSAHISHVLSAVEVVLAVVWLTMSLRDWCDILDS